MSYEKQSSSTIIFEEEENERQKEPEDFEVNIIKVSSQVKQKLAPKEIETNLIKIKSTPRLRTRGKVVISGPQWEEPAKLQAKQQNHDNNVANEYEENSPTSPKSETQSNKQTKPTKTMDEPEVDDEVEEINIQNFTSSLYSRSRKKPAEKKEEPPDTLRPCKGKRQLGDSSDDEKIQQKEQEYQSESESESQDEPRQRMAKQVKVNRPPPVNITFGRQKLQRFVNTAIKPGFQMECIIQVEAGFFGIGNKYHLKQKFEPKVLLSAKKELMSLTPKILLSLSKENHSRRSQDFIGIMESNFSGTKWWLKRPIISARLNKGQVCEDFRDIAFVEYSSSVMGSKSIREMRVFIIDPELRGEEKAKANLSTLLQSKKKKHLTELVTAKPVYTKGKYQLDFKGIAKMPSSKNFILKDGNGEHCLIMAKQSEDSYQMNIRYPLSMAQGFGLCLASLDSKLLVN